MYVVIVKNGENRIRFLFGHEFLADAMKFAQDCMETGESGTSISVVFEAEVMQ